MWHCYEGHYPESSKDFAPFFLTGQLRKKELPVLIFLTIQYVQFELFLLLISAPDFNFSVLVQVSLFRPFLFPFRCFRCLIRNVEGNKTACRA
jgi:hypothetical protein